MAKMIVYKGENISPNSHAATLHAEKKFKELNYHLRLVHERWLKESGRDPKQWTQHPDIAYALDPHNLKAKQ